MLADIVASSGWRQGQHLRFDDETGEAHEASPMHMPLRGVPPRAGVHLRFDE